MNKNEVSKKIALTGILCAQAIVLSFLESFIPPIAGFPPGAKPGFSNIVVMFSAGSLGIAQTFAITILKAIFAGVTRGFSAFFISLAGGVLSTAAAIVLLRFNRFNFGYVGIGMICALCHNVGQLIAACVIAATPALFWSYGPFLFIMAAFTGFLTGTVLKYIMPVLNKQMKLFK